MHLLIELTSYLNDVIFGLLALVALLHWRRARDEGSSWIGAAFAGLASVAGLSLLLPEDATSGPLVWAQKLLLMVLVLFPYFLYRFAVTLAARKRRTISLSRGGAQPRQMRLPLW